MAFIMFKKLGFDPVSSKYELNMNLPMTYIEKLKQQRSPDHVCEVGVLDQLLIW